MEYSKINDLYLHNKAIVSHLEDAAKRVISSGWYALGPEVEEFEKSFASWCGAHYCRGVANGTDAIEIALRSLGVQEGSEVILAANAGMYSSTAIASIGAKPVYAEIDPYTFNIDHRDVANRITSNTQVIIATHLFGRLCDMPSLRLLADQHNIFLLEDCAQSHGASLNGKKAGTWADAAAFSFYPTKNLGALGDGGAIVTSRQHIFTAITQLRQYGWEGRYKVVSAGGCNSRLDELQAALLSTKLPYLDAWTQRRQALGKYYSENIRHPLVAVSPYAGEQHVYHLYVVRCSRRDDLREYLGSKGIATDIHYPLLDYQQPIFAGHPVSKTSLPHSELASKEILTLPCYPELSPQSVSYVVDTINNWKA